MGRTARHRGLILVVLAACGGTPAPRDVTVSAPQGLGELVPGGTVAIVWTVTGAFDPATTTVVLTSRGDQAPFPIVDHGAGGAGTTAPTTTGFTWGGTDVLGHALPPGYYDLSIDLGDGPIAAGDAHVIVVQGLAFTQPAPGGAPLTVSAAAPGELDFTTSTASTLDVKLYAGATMIKDVPVPGELRTVARTITWDGAPVAPGTYTLSAQVTGDATYTVTGGTAIVQ